MHKSQWSGNNFVNCITGKVATGSGVPHLHMCLVFTGKDFKKLIDDPHNFEITGELKDGINPAGYPAFGCYSGDIIYYTIFILNNHRDIS